MRGVPAPCTPRDVSQIEEWFAEGVPLALILRVLDEAVASHGKGSTARQPIRSLTFVKAAVRARFEEQRRLAPSRTAAASEFTAALLARSFEALAARVEASALATAGDRARDVVADAARVLRELAGQVRDPVPMAFVEEAEAVLAEKDRALLDAIARDLPDMADASRRQAEADLAQHRGRMDSAEHAAAVRTRADALARKLASIPDVGLFFLGDGS
ncbi:MAG: hypothetical protein U0166_07230 [Acidobacteriota bacterium]